MIFLLKFTLAIDKKWVDNKAITQRLGMIMMRRNSNAKSRKEKCCTPPLSNPVLFDHYINKNLHPRPEPKSKTVDKEGWKRYIALCLMFLVTPFFVFSETTPHYAAANEGLPSTFTTEETFCKP